jgi:outer membrane protein assembly factor BamE (lipoprotein component of BamABCDE complex)
MIKILYIIFLSLVVTNCSLKPVVKHHGVPFLEKKQKSLTINKSNKNDIKEILGNPSTTSKFDNDIWIYIERKQSQSQLKNLGKMKIFKNNVLVLEIDNYGVLKKKNFITKMIWKKLKLLKLQRKWD